MPSDYAAFAADFYINMRLNLKMDLAMRRDTVLSLFDRVRREVPQMNHFKRYTDELALESRQETEPGQQWLAVRKTSVRSGSVNPETTEHGYALHKLVLEAAPYYLDISALDIDHIELLWGFDLPATGNHDSIVFNALYGNSPIAVLVDGPDPHRPHNLPIVDCQPLVGVALTDEGDLQAHFEVKTRSNGRQGRSGEVREEPISVYLIMRQLGPFSDMKDVPGLLKKLAQRGEELLDTAILPRLLVPIRDSIAAGGGG